MDAQMITTSTFLYPTIQAFGHFSMIFLNQIPKLCREIYKRGIQTGFFPCHKDWIKGFRMPRNIMKKSHSMESYFITSNFLNAPIFMLPNTKLRNLVIDKKCRGYLSPKNLDHSYFHSWPDLSLALLTKPCLVFN